MDRTTYHLRHNGPTSYGRTETYEYVDGFGYNYGERRILMTYELPESDGTLIRWAVLDLMVAGEPIVVRL